MRADRLVSMVLLLRQRGRMTAAALAEELEVSTRTVLRDMEALSAAGVPVWAERGRHGGFGLLPGFRTELTGLNHDEALALLTAGSGRGGHGFGLGSALASAMRKVVDALPDGHSATVGDATRRFLVEPETDLLSRRSGDDDVAGEVMVAVRQAVVSGMRLRITYTAPGAGPVRRVVDPIGLVTVRGRTYLLATRDGQDRTYRLARMAAAEVLAEPARRPSEVDLDELWRDRGASFLSDDHLAVVVRVARSRRDELVDTTRSVTAEAVEADGWLRLAVTFEDLRHAVWAVWHLAPDVEAISPASLREALRQRAARVLTCHDAASRPPGRAGARAGRPGSGG